MKLKEIIIYLTTIAANLLLGLLFTTILFDTTKNFTLVTCGIVLLSIIVVFIVSSKLTYNLDIFAYNITDIKYLIVNSIFIGNLFSIPIAVFFPIIL